MTPLASLLLKVDWSLLLAPYCVCVVMAQSAISMVIGSETRVMAATNSGVKSILRLMQA
jgi:hypothetical protein